MLYTPGDGESPFVELRNASGSDVDVDGLQLANEQDAVLEIPAVGSLGAGEVMLVVFDGTSTVEGTTVHSAITDFLDDESGLVELQDADGILDRISWGGSMGNNVNLGAGAMGRPAPEGSSIGRPGTLSEPFARLQWIVFYDGATPGTPNPNISVSVLMPLDGAVFETSDVPLTWYPVPGATQYRVRVSPASDPANPILDETVSKPGAQATALANGDYLWSVQPIASTGADAPASATRSFSVENSSGAAMRSSMTESSRLMVDLIMARKDTSMLLLESDDNLSEHAWDVAHPNLDMDDSADRSHALEASVAMINAYLGGLLSQDRISFAGFEDRLPGPEGDLGSGFLPNDDNLFAMLDFAFSDAEAEHTCASSPDLHWDFVTEAIDNDVPLIGLAGGDAAPLSRPAPGLLPPAAIPPDQVFVVTGYAIVPGLPNLDPTMLLAINDPLLSEPYSAVLLLSELRCVIRPPIGTFGRFEENEIFLDTDGDGVVDFDETHRFGTDPNHADTDRDGLGDKEDIAETVFGLGPRVVAAPPGRDWDGDGIPMELDCDGDNDGIKDGDDPDNFTPIGGTVPPDICEPPLPILTETGELSYGDYGLPPRPETRLLRDRCPVGFVDQPCSVPAPPLQTDVELQFSIGWHSDGVLGESSAFIVFVLDPVTGTPSCVTFTNDTSISSGEPCNDGTPIITIDGSFSDLTFGWPAELPVFRANTGIPSLFQTLYAIRRTALDDPVCDVCAVINESP